jgi:hypothetical protein
LALGDVKPGEMVLAGKEAAAGQRVQPRRGVAAWDIHPVPAMAVDVVPLDRDPVGGIFGGQPQASG